MRTFLLSLFASDSANAVWWTFVMPLLAGLLLPFGWTLVKQVWFRAVLAGVAGLVTLISWWLVQDAHWPGLVGPWALAVPLTLMGLGAVLPRFGWKVWAALAFTAMIMVGARSSDAQVAKAWGELAAAIVLVAVLFFGLKFGGNKLWNAGGFGNSSEKKGGSAHH